MQPCTRTEPQTDEAPRSPSVSESPTMDETLQRATGTKTAFFGLDVTKVAYIASNRSTHSDVMSTVTSLVLPSREEDFTDAEEVNRKKRGVSVNLSIPATKLNRELMVERKLFFERLHKERVFRAQVEQGAATMIQALVRGQQARKGLSMIEQQQGSREEDSRKPALSRKRQRAALLTGTKQGEYGDCSDEEQDIYFARLKEENRLRKYLSQMRRHTDRIVGDAGYAGMDKNMRALFQKYIFIRKGGKKGKNRYGNVSKKKLHRMVVRLQCCARQFMARRLVRVALLYRSEEAEREAAMAIQRRFRMHRHSEMCKNRDFNAMTNAAVMIQANARRMLDQRFVDVVRAHLRRAATEKNGAIIMQNLLRRKVAKDRVARARMDKASVKVQAGFRGHQARRKVSDHKRQRSETAIKLQALHRGRLGRKRFTERLAEKVAEQNVAATKVQTLVRGNSARKLVELRRQDRAATRIQAKVRQKAAHQKKAAKVQERKKHAAATTIQSKARARMAGRRVSEVRETRQKEYAATKIQCAHRSKQAKAERQKRHHARRARAATKIQTAHRGKQAKKVVDDRRKDFAASKIQRSFRSNAAKRDLQVQRESLNERLRDEAEKTLSETMSLQKVRRASRDTSSSS